MHSDLTDASLADDLGHPIPRVFVFDVQVTSRNTDGEHCCRRGIVIATPLKSDSRTRLRLQRKVESYVEAYEAESKQTPGGKPDPALHKIYISVHPASEPEMLSLVDKYCEWIESRGISIELSYAVGGGDGAAR